jgi:hypothetical protein
MMEQFARNDFGIYSYWQQRSSFLRDDEEDKYSTDNNIVYDLFECPILSNKEQKYCNKSEIISMELYIQAFGHKLILMEKKRKKEKETGKTITNQLIFY